MCAVTYTAVQNGGEQLDFQIVNKDEGSWTILIYLFTYNN